MLPFSGFGPFDRSERKALLFAAIFSCLFIAVLAVARPHPRQPKISTNDFTVPPPTRSHSFNEADLSGVDSFAKYRVRPEHFGQIDFTNHSYGPYNSSNGKRINLKLEHGLLELPNNSGWFELKDVYYTDMTGDNREEAIVWLTHESCGSSCNGGASLFYIYTVRNGKLKPIWQYETGSYADGCGLQSFTAGGTQIVLELFGRCPKSWMEHPEPSKFVAKDLTFILFEFDGGHFEQKSTEFFDSASTNVKNYEPGIRIY
jgi:hypothetical protein